MGYRLRMLNVIKETDLAEKRDFLISQGYTLMEEALERKPDSGSVPSGFEDWKIADLKHYAEENGVDISGLKAKKEIAGAIRAAEEVAGGGDENAADDGGESNADDEGADGAAG